MQIPALGGLDEFDRKTVRNDYPLLSLWEMCAKRLRIPISDLRDDVRLKRLHDLVHLGFRFTLFSHGCEGPEALEMLIENAHLLEAWEITGAGDEVARLNEELLDGIRKLKVRLFFSPLRSKSDIIASGDVYYHVIIHGYSSSCFKNGKFDELKSLSSAFDGIVIRCGITDSVQETLEFASRIQRSTSLQASVHLRLSADNPAQYQNDEILTCNRLAEAMLHAW